MKINIKDSIKKVINIKLIIFIIIFVSFFGIYKAVDILYLGYLHNQIHELTVPEYKEFNEKIKKLFKIQNTTQRNMMIKEIKQYGKNLIEKLNGIINENDNKNNLTAAQIKTIKEVIYKIEEKLKKLVKTV